MIDLSVEKLPNIKKERGAMLKKLGIVSVFDLLNHFPKTYEDRSKEKKIIECFDSEKCLVKAKIKSKNYRAIRKNLDMIKLTVFDETGKMEITYFNQKYMFASLIEGEEYLFFGKVKRGFNKIEMTNPVTEKDKKNTGGITPIYSLTKGLSQNVFSSFVKSAICAIEFQTKETLPEYIKRKYNLCDILFAYKNIHFPGNEYALSLAKQRFVFEELLLFELGLLQRKSKNTVNKGIKFTNFKIAEELAKILPFELTGAQKRVIREIAKDIKDGKQLNRLVQGDVGSGKTMIALCASLMAVNSGYQGAIMAPTEILACQHYEEMEKYFSHFGYKAALLTGSTKKKEKEQILKELKEGKINVLIGTHAIIEEDVEFKNLALCVTDEQHRFGVNQRGKLYEKGKNPHFLVMSATPIPRTLALIMYSDLDVSIIDELPPGRKQVKTIWAKEEERKKIDAFLGERLKNNDQIYIVCPLVEETENVDESLKNAVEYSKEIEKKFPQYNVAFLHGKMKNEEKDKIMMQFKTGEIKILVSTTVIEVGVNVPNATVMMVENAERFGLSQLHQLRGRVGRGEKQAYNILVCDNPSKTTLERLKVMIKINDGFKISEKDLELRGPGDFFGTAQSGFIDMKIANFLTDVKTLNVVMEEAREILEKDPYLEKEENTLLRENVKKLFGYG